MYSSKERIWKMNALSSRTVFLTTSRLTVEILLNCIRELLGSKFNVDTGYFTEIFSGLPRSLEANAAKLSRIGTMIIPFQIISSSSYSLLLDALYWEIQCRKIAPTMKTCIGSYIQISANISEFILSCLA